MYYLHHYPLLLLLLLPPLPPAITSYLNFFHNFHSPSVSLNLLSKASVLVLSYPFPPFLLLLIIIIFIYFHQLSSVFRYLIHAFTSLFFSVSLPWYSLRYLPYLPLPLLPSPLQLTHYTSSLILSPSSPPVCLRIFISKIPCLLHFSFISSSLNTPSEFPAPSLFPSPSLSFSLPLPPSLSLSHSSNEGVKDILITQSSFIFSLLLLPSLSLFLSPASLPPRVHP